MVRNKKLELDELFNRRKEVLARWPTGSDIDLEEAIEYRKRLPDSKKMVKVLAKYKSEGKILVGAHFGSAIVEEMIEHYQALQEAGADYSSIATDTYTRRARYSEAEKALQASIKQGCSLLNGYPVVNLGLSRARRIRENVDMPLPLGDSVNQRCELTTEIILAGGFERVSGTVQVLLMAMKDYSIEEKIKEVQYQDRLAGYYIERGAPVQVGVHVHLCGLDPPAIKLALLVLQALLTAEQGVNSITVSPSLTAHLIQDVALLRLAREMVKEYLQRFGYEVSVALACDPFLGPYPRDQVSMLTLLPILAAIPVLAGVDLHYIKSPLESISIATKESNVRAIKIAKRVRDFLGKQRYDGGEEFKLEKEMMRREAEAIIDKTLELGEGDPAIGQVKAVEVGVIDVQFSPYRRVKGLVFPLRDDTGAIRWLRHGNIPLPKEVIEYHHESLAKRQKGKKESTISMMISDVNYLSMGE